MWSGWRNTGRVAGADRSRLRKSGTAFDLDWRFSDGQLFDFEPAEPQLEHRYGHEDQSQNDAAGGGCEPVSEAQILLRAYFKGAVISPEKIESEMSCEDEKREKVNQREGKGDHVASDADFFVKPGE